jgi:hypothetical protein
MRELSKSCASAATFSKMNDAGGLAAIRRPGRGLGFFSALPARLFGQSGWNGDFFAELRPKPSSDCHEAPVQGDCQDYSSDHLHLQARMQQ